MFVQFQMHQVSTVEHYCSLSVVVRMAYVLCNNCCGDLGIELIPGKHIPSTSVPVKVKENDKEQSQELNSMIEVSLIIAFYRFFFLLCY